MLITNFVQFGSLVYIFINIIIIIIIPFMQGIYIYIPETNNVSREYIVAAILLLLFMVPISVVPALALLCFYVSTFRNMCAVPNVAVFCGSQTSWFPGMLLTYFLNDLLLLLLLYYYYYHHHNHHLLYAGYLYIYS
jgi:hypothetical protein